MRYPSFTIALLTLSLATVAPTAPGQDAAARLEVPSAEMFTAPALDAAWSSLLAPGNAVQIADGALNLRAQANTRAHLKRPFGQDSVRVSVRLKAGSAEAPAALYLAWDNANFIQFGINHPASGRINVREALGTYPHDYALDPVPAGEWRTLAVELARDCIRYFASVDGRKFKCLHVSPRPERFHGAPQLLGLGQDPEGKLFHPPSPWMTAPTTTAVNETAYRELRVAVLPAKAAAASAAERRMLVERERDLLGEQELAPAADPSLASIRRHFPALQWSREAVGVKDHPFTIGVAPDASLQLTESIASYRKPVAFFRVNDSRFGAAPAGCAKQLMNGWMPIVISSERRDGWELQQTVFGYSPGFSPDEPLVGFVRFRATNPGAGPRNLKLELVIDGVTNAPAPLNWMLNVPAHGYQEIAVRVPFLVQATPPTEVPLTEFDAKLKETLGYWERLVAQGSRFEIPEPEMRDAYRAWIAYNFLNVHKRGDVFHVCDGSGFYDRVYGYSAALFCNNLDLLGYPREAEKYLDSLLTFMQPNGLLAVHFGDTDTGAALWTMSEHYWITRDADWLRRVAPKMLQMCDWIIGQRADALAKADQEPAVARGFIRYKPYADLLHPAADYFSNSYLWKGLNAAADALAAIGMSEPAARLKREAEAYRKDIRASMDAARFADRGESILPMIPDTRELWKESNGSADGYYGIIAPMLLETGILAAREPITDGLIHTLQQRGGLMLGVPQFHQMIDHAYGYGYWMTCLERNEPKRVLLGLYASMAYGMSRGTWAAVECTPIRTGKNYWTLPHTYSNTQQLRLLRHLLLWEDGDNLRLGEAMPRQWLQAGNQVAVNEAPTRFGPLSYRLQAGARSIRVELTPPMRPAPREISLRLRHPKHRSIARIKTDRPAQIESAGEMLRWQNVDGPLTLDVTFR